MATGTVMTLLTLLGIPAGGGLLGLVLGLRKSPASKAVFALAKAAAKGDHLSAADKKLAKERKKQIDEMPPGMRHLYAMRDFR